MKQLERQYSLLDRLCIQAEQGLRLVAGVSDTHNRANPALGMTEDYMTSEERKYAAALMRVNHAGEVCAQALYFGQALLARRADLQAHLQHAALEEGDHLLWCQERIHELGSHTSYLNPAWYTFSVLIGMFAACCGDKISLGFIAATEEQVEQHLEGHLERLPVQDEKSRKIIRQMQIDEQQHGANALAAGGEILPEFIQNTMRQIAKVMTRLAYYI
jgi:ubiquinone biosynthesis monooxygenase Coq7